MVMVLPARSVAFGMRVRDGCQAWFQCAVGAHTATSMEAGTCKIRGHSQMVLLTSAGTQPCAVFKLIATVLHSGGLRGCENAEQHAWDSRMTMTVCLNMT